MTRTMINVITAELIKLRSLPVALTTMIGTVAVAVVLAAAIAASGPATSPQQVVIQSLSLVQVGLILLGALTVGAEYTGANIRTALLATPSRGKLLAGKCAAYLITAVTTSVAAVLAGLLVAMITLGLRHSSSRTGVDSWPIVGASMYLVLIGSLALVVALLLRSLISGLVMMLSLVLIISPLLSNLTPNLNSYTQYLPDRAGSLLYRPETGTVLNSSTGTLVLLAWIAVIGAGAALGFRQRDA